MPEEELAGWTEQFLAFHDRFAPYFYRAEAHKLLALALPWPPCPPSYRPHWSHWRRRH